MKTVYPFVNGRSLKLPNAQLRDVINPATGKVVARQVCCDRKAVDGIVASSRKAFESAEWRGLTPSARARLLLKLADLIDKNAEKLIELELQDTGKPIAQLRGGELPLAAALIRFYAGAADKLEGSVKNTEGGFFSLTTWEPYGVVGGILPWNYPVVNVAMKVAPALAAGNAIILKPSIETPLSAEAFAKLCTEAGLPDGIVNVATGSGSIAGQALAEHPSVSKVSFTGSTSIGKEIQRIGADQLKAVNLECGGKNAVLVFADADLERAAQAVLVSAFVNAGQLCVSCSRLLVQRSIAKKFVGILQEKVRKLTVGDPRNPRTLIGPMITKSQYETVLDLLAKAKAEGCTVAFGGGKAKVGRDFAGGYWIEPTALLDVQPGMTVHDQEIFGPVLSVTTFKDEEEAVRISNSVEYGLSGSVWTGDGQRALRIYRALRTGIVWINTMLTGYPEIPVSPHKMSGTGVELGMEGLMAYCKRKSAVLGYDNKSPMGWNL
jgi:acyl-CoA reductase-like NAD-dependent aldehyde dehydrogenase